MTKNNANTPLAQDAGAPSGLVLTLLIGIPFFSALVLQAVFSDIKNLTPSFTMAAFVLQGLTICFYWRRLRKHWLKQLSAWMYILGVWTFMTLLVLAGALQNFVVNIEPTQILAIGGLFAVFASSFIFVLAFALTHKGTVKAQTFATLALAAALVAGLAVTRQQFTDISPGELALAAKQMPELETHEMPAQPGENNHYNPNNDDQKQKALERLRHENTESFKNHGGGPSHWSYLGHEGPDFWASLSPDFKQCSAGRAQSPIDIPRSAKSKDAVKLKYNNSDLSVIDNGHTIQMSFEPGSLAYIDGHRYELVQLHFHTPSEHTFAGISYPMEAHFVHKDDHGKLAVIGVMVEKGHRNHFVDVVWNYIPQEKQKEHRPRGIQINPMDLLPKNKEVFQYSGSLTTPPCSEGVAWNVMKHTIQMSHEQIEQFRQFYNNNARPVQNINNRRIGLTNTKTH